MVWGQAVFLSCVALTSFAKIAKAEQTVDPFLLCSAEFYARHEYNRALERTNLAHQRFLMDRAFIFLRKAEARAPKEAIGCGDGEGTSLGLVFCLGPAELSSEQRVLMLDRLTVLAEEHGPDFPLPVCMEDEACSECLRTLGDARQASTSD